MKLRYLKPIPLFILLIAFAQSAFSATILWTKDHPDGNYIYELGSDGSVALTTWDSNDSSTLYWYNSSGELISEIDRSNTPYVESIRYVSDRDLLYEGRDDSYNRFTVAASLGENNEVEEVKVHHDFTGNRNPTVMAFPYFLSRVTGQSDVATFTLWSVADRPDIKIVGDLVTGTGDDALHIRWATEPRSIYKIQTSNDLETWTDYSEEIMGDGTTKAEDIPVTQGTKYARIIQI